MTTTNSHPQLTGNQLSGDPTDLEVELTDLVHPAIVEVLQGTLADSHLPVTQEIVDAALLGVAAGIRAAVRQLNLMRGQA